MRNMMFVRLCACAGVLLIAAVVGVPGIASQSAMTGPSDAPTGFALASNGFAEEFCARQRSFVDSPNSPQIPSEECNFAAAAEEFTGPETIADGLGPIFNAAGCGDCHLTPILGGSSQIVEKRAGFFDGRDFFDHPGGSLIHDRATDVLIQELSMPDYVNVMALRASLSVLGDGFVEAIANGTLEDIARDQPSSMRGTLISVPVLEKPGAKRVGRFGWKGQHASLTSFSADAYKNEMGITSPLEPEEPSSNGNSIAEYDTVADPDDEGVDVELFALFMRSTLAPPQDIERGSSSSARAGSTIFNNIGCAVCHTREIVTAAPGTLINGGALKVSNALGNKRIRPFGDFLLHDVGTGDGIVQNGGRSTRNKIRTAPLWGLRARGRFMHDGLSFDVTDAIMRHDRQAASSRESFKRLSSSDKQKLLAFLMSL
jgi:CxxC motif-containing protein (DUF1111 family)